jgi:presqualene diphosphate synthase
MAVLYAVAREMDDAVDTMPNALEALKPWQDDVMRIKNHMHPIHPLMQAFSMMATRHGWDISEVEMLMDGMMHDAIAPLYQPTIDVLLHYCRQVAGTIGVLTLTTLAPTYPHRVALATVMGYALQLTNILRDVSMDAHLGRCYIPRDVPLAPVTHQYFMDSKVLLKQGRMVDIWPVWCMWLKYFRLFMTVRGSSLPRSPLGVSPSYLL